jgi:hypothetical protein
MNHFVIKETNIIFVLTNRGVEQLVARWAHNPKAAGSSPAPATKKEKTRRKRVFSFYEFINHLIFGALCCFMSLSVM